jgi:hypothetical protein
MPAVLTTAPLPYHRFQVKLANGTYSYQLHGLDAENGTVGPVLAQTAPESEMVDGAAECRGWHGAPF